ncbi:unnamed protein product [Nippostrongylus brasiliensis]|uniref:Late endosomal/lysosomal adaptor and MAPK and MTOR activator 5 n=1 Tax=Nippostrongylus brasiliensis TaxID=27835 RepID=A0A0N4YTX4_NIPBR|nr:unnamed protein product [Nippostrongylus brasiliensis]
MESLMETKIDHLMAHSGVVGVCVADANGLPMSARGTLNGEIAPMAAQLITLCSQLEPSNPTPPQVTLMAEHAKVTFSKQDDLILALHQKI